MRSMRTGLRGMVLAGAVCVALLAVAGMAPAATVTYPGGGSGFDDGGEGWSAGNASCTPAELLCSSEAVYDATTGNPPGSIAAKTTVTVNLAGLFKGTATWNSPQFRIPVGAITDAEIRLDRAFDPGGLVDVEPVASYVVTLSDLTTGTSTTALTGELEGEDEDFTTSSAPLAVVGGHRYSLTIDTETAQSALALSLLSGTASLRFDNVGLVVHSASGGGNKGGGSGGKGSGPGSLSDKRLFSLFSTGSASNPAVLKGNRLLVRVSCPAKIGRACRIAAQGLLGKSRPATAKRSVRVGRGRGKLVALSVKPKARQKLAKRKRLLVRERVRAGEARATVYKRRKLIRRG
jgi:hypothetical protein